MKNEFQENQFYLRYTGGLSVYSLHKKSGTTITTDAPLDNNGLGRYFSPTDTVASALASCMLTIMGIRARNEQIDIDGMEANVKKVMTSDPRRIGEIHIDFFAPRDKCYEEREQKVLEAVAMACPVAKSLHPNLKQVITFDWGEM